MYDGFVARARSVEALLHDARTTFVVVSTLEAAPLREAEFFISELAARKLHLGAVILNKTLPGYLLGEAGDGAARALVTDPDPAAAAAVVSDPDLDPVTAGRVLATIGESFLNFEVAAKREAELQGEMGPLAAPVLRVPAFEEDIHDLPGLARLGECLFS
jgi:anion-transporting  ArsA/GET3 family ATPase